MTELERLLIEQACTRLVHEFAMYNDFDQIEKMCDLFVEDGSFVRPMHTEYVTTGRAEILSSMKARPPRLSRHIITNIIIDVISPDEARGVSYLSLLTTTDVDKPFPITSDGTLYHGEYHDDFVRTEEGWRFKSRRGQMTLFLKTAGD